MDLISKIRNLEPTLAGIPTWIVYLSCTKPVSAIKTVNINRRITNIAQSSKSVCLAPVACVGIFNVKVTCCVYVFLGDEVICQTMFYYYAKVRLGSVDGRGLNVCSKFLRAPLLFEFCCLNVTCNLY